jgi:hypothetical protein
MGTLNGKYDGSVVNGYLELEVSPNGTRRVIEQWSERVHPGMPYRRPDHQEPSPESSGDERQRQGAERGRKKGVEINKQSGKITAAKIEDYIARTNANGNDRGLAAKAAAKLGIHRSTVARHLKEINKQK